MSPARTDALTRAVFVIAALCYAGLPAEALAGFPLDVSRSYLSELSASDQPTSGVFRVFDATAGSLVLVGVFRLRRQRVDDPWPLRAALLGAAGFGALTIADAAVPMACATSADAACAAADAAGTLGVAHQVHAVTSAGASTAVIVSAVLLVAATLRRPASPRGLTAVVRIGVAVLVVATAAVTVAAIVATTTGTLPAGGGYLQRAQVLLLSGYLAALPVTTAALRRSIR